MKHTLPHRTQAAFTLIELLVVMTIIAVMVGAAALAIRTDNRDRLLNEAERFHQMFDLAKDEALFQSRSLGIGFAVSGYAFFAETDTEALWEVMNDSHFKANQYFNGALSEIVIDNGSIDLPDTITRPDVLIAADGEVTPFEFILGFPGVDAVKLKYNGLGRLEIEEPNTPSEEGAQ